MKRKPLSAICFMLAFLLVGCGNKLNSAGMSEESTNIVIENSSEFSIVMENDIEEKKSLYVGDYTGYLDENKEYVFYETYKGLDFDSDGLIDRVYWEYVSEDDTCNIELRFGDGSVLRIEKADCSVMPAFYTLPNKESKVLIAYYGTYPGQCGEGVFANMAFYEKYGMDYVLSKVPFYKAPYDVDSFPQYMGMKICLVDDNTIGYSCNQIPDFYEEIEMTTDECEAADISHIFNSTTGNSIDIEDCMFYRMGIYSQDTDVVECFAHIIYHCDDEFMVGLQYVNDEWKIVYARMVKR